jgi:hypothetical protein
MELPTFTIEPPSLITFISSCRQRNVPTTFTLIIFAKYSASRSVMGTISRCSTATGASQQKGLRGEVEYGAPATFAQPSGLPNFVTVCSIQERTESRLPMSTGHVQNRPFALGISLSISSLALDRFSTDVAHMETVAPRTSRYLLRARPRPLLAPVMVMTLPAKGCVLTA